MELAYILIATLLVSVISLVGISFVFVKVKKIQKLLPFLVAFAAGSMLGTALFNLLPETIELFEEGALDIHLIGVFILLGIILFYIIEKFIHWHHHHDIDCHAHSVTSLSLLGDGFHNFLDGVLIAGSFMVDPVLGLATTLAVIFHELPQEFGDMAILLHNGFTKGRALLWNFASGLFSVIGGVVGYFFVSQSYVPYVIAITAGSFLYISLTDIIPELHKNKHGVNRNVLTLALFLGMGLMYIVGNYLGHAH